MTSTNRRSFILSTALALGIPILKGFANTGRKSDEQALKNISLGLISGADNPEEELKVVRDLGFSTCQLNIKDYSPELAKPFKIGIPEANAVERIKLLRLVDVIPYFLLL